MDNSIKKLQDLYNSTHQQGYITPDPIIAMRMTADFLQFDLEKIIDNLHENEQFVQGLEKENAYLRRLLIANGIEFKEEVEKLEGQRELNYGLEQVASL